MSVGVMRLWCVCALLVSCRINPGSAQFTPTVGPPLNTDDGNFSKHHHMEQQPIQLQPQQVLQPLSGSVFNLKVQVNDALSRQFLSQAEVEVYVNYSRTDSALTGQDGSVLLHVPYHNGLPITVVASKDGYMCTPLPYTTSRMPIFSSVTMSLQTLNQGNMWLFEDSVLITARTSDTSHQPTARFPKSLLNLTHSSNFSSFRAYLTVPKLKTEQDGSDYTVGIVSQKSGYVSVELNPLAAVSVQLFSGDSELDVIGPVEISLGLPDGCGLQTSHGVPAWFFNRTTGGWMRKGLGTVISVDGKLIWTFTAPHLGYWIAASLSPTRGFFGVDISIDFLLRHSFSLMVLFGGMLVTLICLLIGLIHYCRTSSKNIEAKTRVTAMKKDQTTSTCEDEVFELSPGGTTHPHNGTNQSFTEKADNRANTAIISMHPSNVITNPGAVAITLECNELDDLTRKTSEQIPTLPSDSLFFYNQPVAILHAPAFFHLEEQQDLAQWSKSATLPQTGASNNKPESQEGSNQTLAKGSSDAQNQAVESGTSEGSKEPSSASSSRVPFGLPESMSVPGTLNEMAGSRHLARTLAGLSKLPSPLPPRAWFVSLEGKPAAEIHYAVSEQQRRRRPVESRETSLDSGVDMSELSQISARRAVTLERNATFVKNASSCKKTPPQ